jgi:DNA-binding LacI/PurR family transcriptional regulator
MSRALSVGYQHISNDLRQQIAKGRLKPGAALPSEARLAEKYSVSRMTVRQGLRVLEDAGLIEVIPAKGRIVSRPGSRRESKVQATQQNGSPRGKQNGQALLLMGAGGADFTHPYLAGIHEGLRQTFEAAGIEWQLRLEPVSGDPLSDIDERFSVAVVFGVYDAPRLAALKNAKVPVVLLNQRPLHGGDAVSTDNFAGGFIAAEEILKRGHRRIVYFHWKIDDPAFRDRYLGFRQACEEAGLADGELRVIPRPLWAEHDVRMREILSELLAKDDAPTALFACTDEWASRICAILETRGVRVPQDVSVVGFDRYVPNVFRGIPELATIEQPGVEVGICAARKAIARMSEPHLPGSVELLVPRWIEGKTLGVPAK